MSGPKARSTTTKVCCYLRPQVVSIFSDQLPSVAVASITKLKEKYMRLTFIMVVETARLMHFLLEQSESTDHPASQPCSYTPTY